MAKQAEATTESAAIILTLGEGNNNPKMSFSYGELKQINEHTMENESISTPSPPPPLLSSCKNEFGKNRCG